MNIPLKITFRNMPPSKAIEDNVREKAAKKRASTSGQLVRNWIEEKLKEEKSL